MNNGEEHWNFVDNFMLLGVKSSVRILVGKLKPKVLPCKEERKLVGAPKTSVNGKINLPLRVSEA